MGDDKAMPDHGITKEILQKAVANEFKAPEATILSYEVTQGAANMQNFSCIIKSVEVRFRLSKGQFQPQTAHYMVKCIPTNEWRAMLVRQGDIFKKEVHFYTKSTQSLGEIREAKGLEPMSFPKCYYASEEEGVIVMEDMTKSGYILVKKTVEGLPLDHASMFLLELAKFHATSYHYLQTYPDGGSDGFIRDNPMFLVPGGYYAAFSNLEELIQNVFKIHAGMYQVSTHVVASLARTADDFGLAAKMNQLVEAGGDVMGQMAKIELLDETNFKVINHGDAWSNNAMFKFDGKKDGALSKVVVLDLQYQRIGSPVCDLAYFFGTSTSPEGRSAHLDDWLKVYHGRLASDLRTFGYEPDQVYPMEKLKQEFSKAGKAVLWFGAIFAQLLMLEKPAPEGEKKWDVNDLNSSNQAEMMEVMAKQLIGSAMGDFEFSKLLFQLIEEADKNKAV